MRIGLVTSVLLLTAARAHAQSLYAGALMGQSSSVQREQRTSSQSIGGHPRLLAAKLEINDWLALRAEWGQTEKGGRRGRGYEMRNRYVEAPVLVQLASPKAWRGMRPFIAVGGSWSEEKKCSGFFTPPQLHGGLPYGTSPLRCEDDRQYLTDPNYIGAAGIMIAQGRRQFSIEFRHGSSVGKLSTYSYSHLKNEVNAVLIGTAYKVM